VFGGTHRYDFEETRRGALVFIWVGLAMGAAQFVSVCLFEFTAERQVRSIHPGLPCPHLRPDFFAQSGHDGSLTDTNGYSRVQEGAVRRASAAGALDPGRIVRVVSPQGMRRRRASAHAHRATAWQPSRITSGQPTFALVPGHAVPARVHQVRAGAGRSSRAPACARAGSLVRRWAEWVPDRYGSQGTSCCTRRSTSHGGSARSVRCRTRHGSTHTTARSRCRPKSRRTPYASPSLGADVAVPAQIVEE
jgi:hypothetical protein